MIKNIIYLDEAKMFSLSSQVFEGITEYMLKETNSATESAEEQKGPLASGRLLANAIRSSERSIEKRFLHDHAFSRFETKLIESKLVLNVDAMTGAGVPPLFDEKAFVRISSPAIFIDAEKITSILSSFNVLGEALAHVTNFTEIQAKLKALAERKQTERNNKTSIAEIKQQEESLRDIAKLAKVSGLYQDPKFLEHLALVTKFGFSDQLELQQRVAGYLYSSCLKRNCLRESDDLTIRKYSRKTEKHLVVLGIVTQTPSKPESVPPITAPENMTMKEAVTNLIDHFAHLENSMIGKAANEVVIDPIAVYVTL